MEDEITECPLEESREAEAGAACASSHTRPPAKAADMADISSLGAKVLTSSLLRASGAVPKTTRRSTVQVFGFPRPGIKDQSQGAQAENRSHRSAGRRPFFCCGSELSLVSPMDSVDLNVPCHGNSASSRAIMCDGKQSLSDSEDNSSNHLLPHSYSCAADDYGAACGSGASIQTVCGTGKATGGTLVRRVKSIKFIHHLVPDLEKITNCSFYWGVIDLYEAERLLDKKREGTFLLRDSAQDDFLFSVSFRRNNRSQHARMNHRFSFDVHDPAVYSADSVCGLIEHYKDSSRCLFYERMLTDPLHRTFPFSLQHLARVVICKNLSRYDRISKLPLPASMKTYLRYYHYKQKVCVRSFEEPSP